MIVKIEGRKEEHPATVIYSTKLDVFVRFETQRSMFGAWFCRADGTTGFPHFARIDPADLTLEKVPPTPKEN